MKHLKVKCQGLYHFVNHANRQMQKEKDKQTWQKLIIVKISHGHTVIRSTIECFLSLKIILRNQILKKPGAEPLWKGPLRLISYVDLGCPPAPHAHTTPALCALPSCGKQVQLSLCLCCWPLVLSKPAKH